MSSAGIVPPGRPRYVLVDALRGAALVAMIGYHIAWDLFYLRVFEVDIAAEPGWIAAQLSILSSFVFLAGVSLVLAHGKGIRWRAFWRREAILVAAALAVSAGTWFAFGEYFAFFGVLHAIALFSLLALPLLRTPLWLVAAIAAIVIAASFLWTDAAFIDPRLAWIGFWPDPPPTVDLVPIFPWFGVLLAGVIVARAMLTGVPDAATLSPPSPLRGGAGGGGPAVLSERVRPSLHAILTRPGGPITKALAFIGRWSLIIYLVHQPLLYGAISGLVSLVPAPAPTAAVLTDAQEFALSCPQSCTDTGTPAPYCTRYCACALDAITAGNLWEALGAAEQSEAEQMQTNQVINLCRAMAETPE